MKFKVGDMVIGNHPTRYGITKKGWVGKVTRVYDSSRIRVHGEGIGCMVEFDVESKYFDLYNEKIVITHDGKTTTATMYRADGTKEQATARCCPEDTFDFNVGAKLAMERLMEKVSPVTEPKKPEPPKYYNGKVVCTANKYGCSIPIPGFTVGKIYDVVDGRITNDDGWTSCENDTNLRDLCVAMGNTFIPLVEDVEDKNEPLTTDELMKMDGQKVWLSSIDDDVENFTDGYCGWYTVNVANGKLYRESFGGWYEIKENCCEYAFKAYRTPPKGVKEDKE